VEELQKQLCQVIEASEEQNRQFRDCAAKLQKAEGENKQLAEQLEIIKKESVKKKAPPKVMNVQLCSHVANGGIGKQEFVETIEKYSGQIASLKIQIQ